MSTYETLNVVTLLGSLRKGSFNGMVVHMLPKVALAEMAVSPLPSIGDIPLYDAISSRKRIFSQRRGTGGADSNADGVVILEYNYTVPGYLKNAIDWLSRLLE